MQLLYQYSTYTKELTIFSFFSYSKYFKNISYYNPVTSCSLVSLNIRNV